MSTEMTIGAVDDGPTRNEPPNEPLEIGQPQADATEAEDETQYPSRQTTLLIFIASGLSLALMGLDGQILAVAIPAITTEFRTLVDIGWYNAGLRLTLCCLLFLFGRLYTIYNSKTVLLTSIGIFEAGSFICAISPTSLALILGRATQGVGCGGIVMGAYAMVNNAIPKRKRPFVLGCLGAVEMASQAMAPLIGGALVTINWRWCFYINLPLGALSMIIIARYYCGARAPSHQELSFLEKTKLLDPFGVALLLPGLLSLLLGLQYGGSVYSWTDPQVVICFVLSALLTILFAWWQIRRQDDAMLPPRILRRRAVLAGMLFLASNNGAISIIQYYVRIPNASEPVYSHIQLPTYFQTIQQLSAQTSGYLVLPFLVPFVLTLAISGTLVSVTGYYLPFMVLSSILTPIASGLLTTLTVESSLVRISCYQALLGFGSGIGFQGPQYAIQALLSHDDLQYGVACLQFGQKFGPAIVLPAAQALFLNSLTAALQLDAPEANTRLLQSSGLTDIRKQVQSNQVQGMLLGFDTALMQTFYLPTALASIIVFGVVATESKSLKRPRTS